MVQYIFATLDYYKLEKEQFHKLLTYSNESSDHSKKV